MEDGVDVLDEGDPNYDSEADYDDDPDPAADLEIDMSRHPHNAVAAFKNHITLALLEYFHAGDILEVQNLISKPKGNAPRLMHYVVKRAVLMSLDHHNREREMVSILLSALYGEAFAAEDIERGFLALVTELPDATLDVPEAPGLIAKFVARAVVDEIIPPVRL